MMIINDDNEILIFQYPPRPYGHVEMPKHTEKERRAVVVKVYSSRVYTSFSIHSHMQLIIRYLDKEEIESSFSLSRLRRRSIDRADTSMRENLKRHKYQQTARTLVSCTRNQVRKWVDDDDQKFMLMKSVNEVCL